MRTLATVSEDSSRNTEVGHSSIPQVRASECYCNPAYLAALTKPTWLVSGSYGSSLVVTSADFESKESTKMSHQQHRYCQSVYCDHCLQLKQRKLTKEGIPSQGMVADAFLLVCRVESRRYFLKNALFVLKTKLGKFN